MLGHAPADFVAGDQQHLVGAGEGGGKRLWTVVVGLAPSRMSRASLLRRRRRFEREAPKALALRMWGFPYLTYVAIAGMVAVLSAMALIPDQRLPLALGVASLAALAAICPLRRRFGSKSR